MTKRSFSLLPALFAASLFALPACARTPQDPAYSPAPAPQAAPATTLAKKKHHVRKPAAMEAPQTEPVIPMPDQVHPITSLPKASGDTSGSYTGGGSVLPSSDHTPSNAYAPASAEMPTASGLPTSIVPLTEGSTAVAPPPAADAATTTAPGAPAMQYTQPGQGATASSTPPAFTPTLSAAPGVVYAQPGQSAPAAVPSAPQPSAPVYMPSTPQSVDVGPPATQVTYTEAPMPEERHFVERLHVRPFSAIALQVKASSLGIGFDVSTPLAQRFNLRAGGSFFTYNGTYDSDGLLITGDANFRSGSASIDIFPFNNGFRISPGITFYNGNNFNANINVPPGAQYDPGDSPSSLSDPTGKDPIRGTAVMSFGKKYAPSLTIGWGNMIPRSGKHLSFPFEIGAEYIDNPSMALTLIGTSCDVNVPTDCEDIRKDPIAQQNLQEEQSDINSALHSYMRFYPIISFGVAWRFGSWK